MKNKRYAALVMAAILAASAAMPAMAEVVIDGDSSYSSGTTVDSVTASDREADAAVSVSEGDSVSVKGNVDANVTGGVGVSADNGKADIGGNVKAEDNNAIEADNKSEVSVAGNVEGDGGVRADDSKVSVGGNVSGKDMGIEAVDGATVDVEGNVTSKDNAGVEANKTDRATDATGATKVTVKGDVTSDDFIGVDASNDSIVEVGGNVSGKEAGVRAIGTTENPDAGKKEEIAKVTVGGNVSAEGTGVYAENADVIVGGNVKSTESTAVDAWDANVSVDGNAYGYSGIKNEDSDISIKGDVTSNGGTTVGIFGTEKTTTIIGGNVKAAGGEDVILDVSENKNADSELAIAGKIENEKNNAQIIVRIDDEGKVTNLPEIIIGEIENINKLDIMGTPDGTDPTKVSDDLKKEVLDNIKYIVSTNTESLNGNGTITVTKVGGGSLDKDKSGLYEVGKATETITIHVATKDGYEVSEIKAGKATASLVKNADGTYSVTIPAGGGVNIEALIKAIETKAVYTSSSDDDDTSSSNGTPSTWGSNGANWTFTKANGQKAKEEWQQISYNGTLYWYYFGADMNMSTGLFTDASGHQYYLNPTEGALKGTMATGWVEVDGKWMFFNDGSVADLPLGCYVEGMAR